jgi:hypothetical protein
MLSFPLPLILPTIALWLFRRRLGVTLLRPLDILAAAVNGIRALLVAAKYAGQLLVLLLLILACGLGFVAVARSFDRISLLTLLGVFLFVRWMTAIEQKRAY